MLPESQISHYKTVARQTSKDTYTTSLLLRLSDSKIIYSDMFGMRKRVFLVEKFIHTLLVIRVFMTHLFSTELYLISIALLVLAQFYKEGLTPKLLVLLPILSLQAFAEMNQSIQLQYIAAILGSVLHFVPLKLYWLPQPKKLVGFRQDSIENGLHYIEFYPLDESKPIIEKSMKWNNHMEISKMVQFAKISNNLLKKIGHKIISFADKLSLKIGQGIEKTTQNSVAFCHGRGGTPLIYSSFLMYFAGLGYKVGAVQHSQINDTKLESREEVKKYREKEVQVRAAQFYQAIAKVDNENIILVGHSYGCATIIQAYHSLQNELKQKIKSIILLDPWLFPLNDKTFSKAISCPVLILANEDFVKNPDMYERNLRFLQEHKADQIQYILWKNAHHLHQTDMGFIAGNLPTICKHSHLSDILLQLNLDTINKFLKGEKVEGTFGQKDLGRSYKPQKFYSQNQFTY